MIYTSSEVALKSEVRAVDGIIYQDQVTGNIEPFHRWDVNPLFWLRLVEDWRNALENRQ